MNRSIESFNGNIVDALRGSDNIMFDSDYDLLKILFTSSNVEKIIFIQDSSDDDMALVSLFDALMKASTDILNMMTSLMNFVTVRRLQVDAVLLLEWMSSIIVLNPFLFNCLWNKLHRSKLVGVKLITDCRCCGPPPQWRDSF